MKKILIGAAALGIGVLAAFGAVAAEGEGGHNEAEPTHFPIRKPPEMNWSFSGPFGTFDRGQLQRGLKVYKESCAACHSMNLVAFRTLEGLGYSEGQVRALAAEYEVQDGPNADGEMFMRPALPSDHFPAPFPNEEAAAASNNGAAPPDFSLIAKARGVERGFPTFIFDIFTQYAENGPDYIHALVTGYDHEPPAGMQIAEGTYVMMAQISTLYYFAFFLVIMPLLGLLETPRRMPNSITEAVLEKNKGGAGHPAGATAAPETKG